MEFFTDHTLDIKKFDYWTLALHVNQSYLGRAICYLNVYKENLVDVDKNEYVELLEIIKMYQAALRALWKPDGWNYVQLGNITPHLHLHCVPRYKEKRIFKGVEFIDEQWGKNYAPAPEKQEDKILNKKIALAIRDAI